MVTWLSCDLPHSPGFCCAGLFKHFTPLVLSDSQKRCEAGLPSQPLTPLVCLYNSVLEQLSSQATSRHLQELQWPPPEMDPPPKFAPHSLPPLHWNSAKYLDSIHMFFSQLAMPHPHDSEGGVAGRGDWSEQCVMCMEFARSQVRCVGMASIPFLSRQAAL